MLDAAVAARGGIEAIAACGLDRRALQPGSSITWHRLAATADELVVSMLPNVPENWLLFSREVLPFL